MPRILIAVAMIAVAVFFLWRMEPAESPEQVPPNENGAAGGRSAPDVPVLPLPNATSEKRSEAAGRKDDCLSPMQIETHPMFMAELERLDPVMDTGPTIASYRSLTSAELEVMAQQKDSAAMAVLGAMSVMRARNLPESNAVSYLLLEDKSLSSVAIERPLPPEVVEHYEEASRWFYRSALHGRLLALRHVGQHSWLMGKGPVEHGWIEKDDYDALSSKEKTAIDPGNIYSSVAYEIAPTLKDGPIGEMLTEISRGVVANTGLRETILTGLVQRFEDDRVNAGLPEIIVSDSAAPSLQEIFAMVCDEWIGDSK